MYQIIDRSTPARFAGCLALALHTSIFLAVVAFFASDVRATALLFDQVPNSGGSLFYNGTGGPLIGTDILFDSINGVDTPLNNGATLTLIDGKLNFVTGPNLIEPPGIYGWGGGGSFVVTADAVKDNLSNDIITPGNDIPILIGGFVGNPTIAAVGFVGGNQITISAFGLDDKNPNILAYFGILPSSFTFAESTISTANLLVDPNLGFTATVAEADITNTAPPNIPEPATLTLLASAAATMLLVRRRILG